MTPAVFLGLFRRRGTSPSTASPNWTPVLVEPPYELPIAQFAANTASILDLQAFSIWQSGATTYLHASVAGKPIRLACNGAMVWVTANLWPNLASYQSGISWAPLDSYMRAELTEGPDIPSPTSNREFDETFVILGPRSHELAASLSMPAQRLLLAHADMVIDIGPGYLDAVTMTWVPEPQLRAGLVLHTPDGYKPGGVRLGEQRFTPIYAAECLRRIASLTLHLEPHEPRQL